MRAALTLITTLCLSTFALAQQPDSGPSGSSAPVPEATAQQVAPSDRYNQRIERIQHEDGGSRVDELRVGGETKRITVQPKVGTLPAYEVQPQKIEGADGTNGRRVWRALQF